ncbi:MAG: UvrD-helicase domain-containing protein [Bacteroidota bacterium]
MCNLQLKGLSADSFIIVGASAGSGKTFVLTKTYLKKILEPGSIQKYRQLLALTFTNKAVAEMKQRILSGLYDFGLPYVPPRSRALFSEIAKELSITSEELHKKAKYTLKELLHNYAFFEVSTIDRFTHRVIRTFAKDLNISQSFDVVLNTDVLLSEAIGNLLNRAGEDVTLTQVLLDFSFEKIENGKSWNIAFDLKETGMLLFQENHAGYLQEIRSKNMSDLVSLKKIIRSEIKSRENDIKEICSKVLHTISANRLEFSDFKNSYFPKFMQKLSLGDFPVDFNAKWKQNFGTEPLYAKTAPEKTKVLLDSLHPDFEGQFDEVKVLATSMGFLKNCYSNIVPLTVLNAIAEELQKLMEERNLLPISEFNNIIAKEIKDQPVPFIYERIGEKYRHFFIDEFQDTSSMQWHNLIPLVGNSIESESEKGQKGSLFLVGDGKQAIYRWRGGRAEQFLNLINLKTNPFSVPQLVERLDTNWRSASQIVNFNNSFFTRAANQLVNTSFQKLFKTGTAQKTATSREGFVEITFLQGHEDDLYGDYVLKVITSSFDKGYRLQDICVLVRDNKKGAWLADYLTQRGTPVVSPDALLLKNNEKVAFLIALLQFINDESDKEAAYRILEFLSIGQPDKHDFISKHIHSLANFLDLTYRFDVAQLVFVTVFEIVETAIHNFYLTDGSDAYLSQFLQIIFDAEEEEVIGNYGFLRYWEVNKEKLNIIAPENIAAVKIMTIHKAKGLEFPIVIFPFANTSLISTYGKKIWLPVKGDSFKGYNHMLFNFNKDLVGYSDVTERIIDEENEKMQLDAFNVLYVALTRAVDALFICTELDRPEKRSAPKSYADLFVDYLVSIGRWQMANSVYQFGRFEKNIKEVVPSVNLTTVPTVFETKRKSDFNFAFHSSTVFNAPEQDAAHWGNLIHSTLSLIETANDIPIAIQQLQNERELSIPEAKALAKKMQQITSHPLLEHFYNGEHKVHNERELIDAQGNFLRPDRIVIMKKSAAIIDYKTGKVDPMHKNQLIQYANTLEQIGYKVENKILIYISEAITPMFL